MTVKLGLWVAIIFFVLCGSFLAYKAFLIEPKVIKEVVVLDPITGETAKVDTFIDERGTIHTTFKASKDNLIDPKVFKDKNREPMFADTVAMVVAKANQLISTMKFQLELKTDSLRAYRVANSTTVRYKDKYAQISYTPSVDTSKVGMFDLAYNNVLTVTDYTKRDKVLGLGIGQKNTYTDIASEDSRTSINGVKKIQIKKPVPFFGLRGQVLSRYNFANNTIGAGLGLRLDLGRVSVLGAYIYTPSNNVITPQLGFNYDVFRF